MDGGHSERIMRLETHFEYIRRDLDRLAEGQAAIQLRIDAGAARSDARMDRLDARADATNAALVELLRRVEALPTRTDLWAWKVQWTAISVGAIALIVGGIVGGLSALLP